MVAALLAVVSLAGCASYQARPLPEQSASASSLSQLIGYEPSALPLDMAAVERLVLLNNPDLRSQHAQRQAARAQQRQDGVLPNPVIGGSVGYLMSGPGDATAWTASISQDIASLITLRPRREAAKARADEVDASLLWEQWLTVGKARLLVVDLVEGERQIALQQQALDGLSQRESRILKAVDAGNAERVSVAPDLAAAAEARASLAALQRQQLDQQQQLDALLGLTPDVVVPLSKNLPAPGIDATAIHQQFDSVSHRRPDLVALQLGYQAQEATLRAAVLAQFPAFAIGYDASQDNSRVRNGGPAVNFTLPLFDHNQHNVAIASATRDQLRQEYTVRLATAHDDVDALLAQYAQRDAQRRAQASATDDAARAASQADVAAASGLLDLRSTTDLHVAAINRQLASVADEQAMLEQQMALELLVGRGMPSSLPQDVMAP
ncbi:TolC family protein [Dyella sp. C11]|uniref:TolC family protein n=1 Tax=Dyella sp. C11 TaxID=2126991 RepID=UPI000D654483|nr:TolC family protein [Dyella sp. C11]